MKNVYEKLLRKIVLFNQWRKRHLSQNTFLIILAGLVGALGGLAASLLKKLTHLLADFLQNDFQWQYKYYLYFFFPLIGITLTVLYIKGFIRKGSLKVGIPPIIHSVTRERSRMEVHNAYSQIITSALTVGMGGSAGLESPSVASGASMGSNLSRLFGLAYKERTLLLACGGAAGISGAFDGPIAGMLFALEVLLPSMTLTAIIPLLVASAVASVVSWMVYNQPLFIYVTDSWTADGFWIFVLFGIVSGFYSVFYAAINEKIHHFLDHLKHSYQRVLVGGISMGILVTFLPALYGEGYITIQKLLDGNYKSLLQNSLFSGYQDVVWILIVFAIISLVGKTIACGLTMGSGGNGGMFGPSVGIGGLLGFVFGYSVNQLGIADVNITHFIVAGMAGSVSGAMHAPLTGVFLAAEITGGYVLMVPLMLVSALSYIINKTVRKYSIYTKELAEKGEYEIASNRDNSVLLKMKVKYLIEKDYVVLNPKDTPLSREADIVHSDRNIFPVVDESGQLRGLFSVEEVLERLLNEDAKIRALSFEHYVQPFADPIFVEMPMQEVLQTMDRRELPSLPVVDHNNRYLGIITKDHIFNRYRKLLVRQTELS